MYEPQHTQLDFIPATYDEVLKIANAHASRKCFLELQDAITSRQVRLHLIQLVENGIAEITDIEDKQLGSYFYILSEVGELDSQARDFLIDAMLWCEENETNLDTFTWKNAVGLKEYYQENIRPLL